MFINQKTRPCSCVEKLDIFKKFNEHLLSVILEIKIFSGEWNMGDLSMFGTIRADTSKGRDILEIKERFKLQIQINRHSTKTE